MPSTSPCSRSRCGRSATLRRHRGPAEPPSGRPANWSVDPGDPDQVLRAAVEGTAVEAAEDLVDGEARGGQQAQHLLGMAEVHFEQAVTPFEDQTVLVEDLGHPALAGNRGDRVEAVVLPQRDALAGVGVAGLPREAVMVLPGGQQLGVGHEHVAGEAAARPEVRPDRGERRHPGVRTVTLRGAAARAAAAVGGAAALGVAASGAVAIGAAPEGAATMVGAIATGAAVSRDTAGGAAGRSGAVCGYSEGIVAHHAGTLPLRGGACSPRLAG